MKLLIALGLSIAVFGIFIYLVTLLSDNNAAQQTQTSPPITAASFGLIPIYFGVKYLLDRDKRDKEKKQ